MILPPTVFHLRIAKAGRKKLDLWLPIILLWPLVIAVMIVLAPLAIILSLIFSRYRPMILAGPRVLATCWAVRGLRVQVKDGKDQVLITMK